MRKKIILIVVILMMLIGGILIMHVQTNQSKVKSFEVCDYQYYIDNFGSEEILGNVKNSEDARKKAEDLWLELYGENIKKKKTYQVFFDAKNEVWMIRGTLPLNNDGGVPYLLIEKTTGKVLAVWHDK